MRFPIPLLFVSLSFWLGTLPTAHAARRPNVVLLFADDQRADTIGAHGNRHIRTPNLDALVRRGFSFRQNYCFGSNSGAVCVPSRAMLMTGKTWLHTNNQMKGEMLLPAWLAQHGYTTFITGKWHNGANSLLDGFQRGEAIYLGGMSDHTEVFLQDIVGGRQLGNKRVGRGFSSQIFADAVIDYIAEPRDDKPFFAYVAFTAPHDPRQPPESYRTQYYANRPPLPENFLPQHPFDNGHMQGGRDENLGPWPRTAAMISDQLCEYYGLITHLDEQVGRIVAAIRDSPHAEDTIIIYAADHGLAMGSHGLLGKQSVYEHSMRCPLIIAGGDVPQNQSTHAFTYLLDLFPTICHLTGLDVPPGLDGANLADLWADSSASIRDSVFLPFRDVQRSVRDRRWKLIAYPQINYLQLFDLASDPAETRNVASDPRFAHEKERMLRLLRKWQADTGDEQPLTVDDPKPKEVDLTGRRRLPDRWQPKWIRDKYFGGVEPSAADQKRIESLRDEFGN